MYLEEIAEPGNKVSIALTIEDSAISMVISFLRRNYLEFLNLNRFFRY